MTHKFKRWNTFNHCKNHEWKNKIEKLQEIAIKCKIGIKIENLQNIELKFHSRWRPAVLFYITFVS